MPDPEIAKMMAKEVTPQDLDRMIAEWRREALRLNILASVAELERTRRSERMHKAGGVMLADEQAFLEHLKSAASE
jgi:hypothetical protein